MMAGRGGHCPSPSFLDAVSGMQPDLAPRSLMADLVLLLELPDHDDTSFVSVVSRIRLPHDLLFSPSSLESAKKIGAARAILCIGEERWEREGSRTVSFVWLVADRKSVV